MSKRENESESDLEEPESLYIPLKERKRRLVRKNSEKLKLIKLDLELDI